MTVGQLRALERIEVNSAAFARLLEQTLAADAEIVGNGVLEQHINDAILQVAHVGIIAAAAQARMVTDADAVTP